MLTCRQYGGFIAGAVVGVIAIPIVQASDNPKTGWLICVGIVCVTMVITGLIAAHGARRVDYYNSLPMPEKVHLRASSVWSSKTAPSSAPPCFWALSLW